MGGPEAGGDDDVEVAIDVPVPRLQAPGVLRVWERHLEALLIKNLHVMWGKKMLLVTAVLLPALFVVALFGLQQLVSELDLAPAPLQLTECNKFNAYGQLDRTGAGAPCVNIAYAPSDNANVTALVRAAAAAAGLTDGSTGIMGFKSAADLVSHAMENMATLDMSVIFESNFTVSQPTLNYRLLVNSSALTLYGSTGLDVTYDHLGYSGRLLGFQNAIDAALIAAAGKAAGKTATQDAASIDVSLGGFSVATNGDMFNTNAVPITSIAGAAFIVTGVVVVALMFMNIVTTEKHKKLLGAMRMMGLYESTHWISWFLVFGLVSGLASVVTVVVGKATSIDLFVRTEFMVHFAALAAFSVSMSAFVLWAASFVRRPRWSNVSAFLTFSISVVMTFMFTVTQLYDGLYSPAVSFAAKLVLWPMPWYHYGKIISDIMSALSSKKGGHAAVAALAATGLGSSNGPPDQKLFYAWEDLWDPIGPMAAKVNGAPVTWYAPSAGFNMQMMLVLCAFYIAVAWYFSQVFSGDLGASESIVFPCTPRYWGFGRKKRVGTDPEADAAARARLMAGDTIAREQLTSLQEGSVRVHKLSKSYDSSTALKEVSVTMKPDELFVLLGQNGAGKTTLLNTLGGLISPSHGEAFVCGLSVREEMAELRTMMGTCPQHSADHQWPELSARAHLSLFARFKGVARTDLGAHVDNLLNAVDLLDEGDSPVGTFSGGMKRRLSVACASVGDVKVIWLDEPSTGMDPLSRRRVWALINQLKRKRIVVLTTHAMEEADALGDTVAVLAGGRLRAVGTTLFLKSRFGAGYQLNLLTTPANTEALKQYVTETLPGAEIVGEAAGNVTVGLPRASTRHLPAFLRRIESAGAEGGTDLVKEWGVSNSTLEEVFLRLGAQQRGVNETAIDFSEAPQANDAPRVCAICSTRLPEPVMLYTSKGVSVLAPDLICGSCAALEPHEVTAMRAAPGQATNGAGAVTVAVDAEGESKAIDGDAPVAAAADEKARAEPPGGIPVAQVVPPAAAPPVAAKHSAGVPHGAASASHPSPTGDHDGAAADISGAALGKGGHKAAKPVSPVTQAAAVFLMRGTLRMKQRKTTACQAIVLLLGVLITWSVTPAPPDRGDLCPEGYVSSGSQFSNYNFDACNVSDIVEYMVGVGSWVSGDNVQWSTLDDDLCFEWDPMGFCVNGKKAPMPDFDQMNTFDSSTGNIFLNKPPPPAQVFYTDATGGTPLSQYNLLGFGKGNRTVQGQINFSKFPSGTDFDARQYADQETIIEKSVDMSGTVCKWYSQSVNHAGLMFPTGQEAWDYMRDKFPDVALTMTKSNPGKMEMGYTVTAYAPSAGYDGSAYGGAQVYYAVNGSNANTGFNVDDDNDDNPNGDSCWTVGPTTPSDMSNWAPGYNTQIFPVGVTINTMNNALLRTVAGDGNNAPSLITVELATWPEFKFVPLVQPIELGFQAFLFPLFTMFLLPAFVSQIVAEKEGNLFMFMRSEGMRTSAYWMGLYFYQLVTFLVSAVYFIGLGLLFSLATFQHVGFGMYCMLLLSWAHAQSGLTFFVAAIMNRGRAATVLTYMLIILVSVVSAVLYAVWTKAEWPAALLWVPPLGYARAAVLTLEYGGDTIYAGSELSRALIYLFITGTACLFLGMYLHAIIPGPNGAYSSASAPFTALANVLCPSLMEKKRRRRESQFGAELTHSGERVATKGTPLLAAVGAGAAGAAVRSGSSGGYGATGMEALDLLGGETDEDVLEERRRMEQRAADASAVAIRGLRKEFAPVGSRREPKVAVNDLYLGMNYGECFGLLGPNGAGKSTTISMISGSLKPTSGRASVAGFDVSSQMDLVYTQLGVVPQFDAPIEDLDVEDHLRFYGRIKGVPRDRLVAAVQSTAEKVQLDGDCFHTAADQLSGGQLRRLSIACAMMGDPMVLVLDEPTTGLDPESRREVWKIIQDERMRGKALCVTSHSMEEIDTLASRIAIIAFGTLRCVGSQLRLKNRFGKGYRLALTLASDDDAAVERAVAFVHANVSAEARLATRVNANLSFSLPREGVDVPAIFVTFQDRKAEAGVVDFGISQTSLEDVFVRVVKQAEAQHEAELRA